MEQNEEEIGRRNWHRKWQTVREHQTHRPEIPSLTESVSEKHQKVDTETLQSIISESYKKLETLYPKEEEEFLSESHKSDKKRRHSFRSKFKKEKPDLSSVSSEFEKHHNSRRISMFVHREIDKEKDKEKDKENTKSYKELESINEITKESKEIRETKSSKSSSNKSIPEPIIEETKSQEAEPIVQKRNWYSHYNNLKEDSVKLSQDSIGLGNSAHAAISSTIFTSQSIVDKHKSVDPIQKRNDSTPFLPPSSSSSLSIPPLPSQDLPQRELTVREKYMKEIIETEDSYIKDMKMVVKNFVTPLRDDQILSKEDIYKIFSNLEDLVKVNDLLLGSLPTIKDLYDSIANSEREKKEDKKVEKKTDSSDDEYFSHRSDSSDSDSDSETSRKKGDKGKNKNEQSVLQPIQISLDEKIGEAFLQVADFLKVYAGYCANQQTSLDTLSRVKVDVPEFSSWLTYVQSFPECRNMDLGSFLIKPIQRICKYPLLLRDLLKYTQKGSRSYERLKKAEEKLEKIVADINEKKRRAENQSKMTQISQSLTGIPPELGFQVIIPSRRYIDESTVKINHKDKYFFLFNDIIIICVKTQNMIHHGTNVSRREAFRFKGSIKLSFEEVSFELDHQPSISNSLGSASGLSAISSYSSLSGYGSFHIIFNSKKKLCECPISFKDKIKQAVKESHLMLIERKASQPEPEGKVRLKVFYQDRPELVELDKDEILYDELFVYNLPTRFQLPITTLWMPHYKQVVNGEEKNKPLASQEDLDEVISKGIRELYLY